MKLDLLTNATVVDVAIRFVNDKSSSQVDSKLTTEHRQTEENERHEQIANNVF